MAKSVVVLILTIFTVESLFPFVDLAELSRLPELWSHFQKHRNESNEITLLEFLNMHYNDPQHSNVTPGDHQKLPFSKTHNHRTSVFQIVMEPINVNPQTVYTCLMEIEGVDYSVSFPNTVASTIWQPPKI
jgi:hypothetical protein